MKLDYLHNINTYGENIVRLYEFDKEQATQFREAIQQTLLIQHAVLDLTTMDFIESRNCHLTLRLSDEDMGMTSEDGNAFFCDLTTTSYEQMVKLLEPFCKKESVTYQWLYDVDNITDFLFSPAGTW